MLMSNFPLTLTLPWQVMMEHHVSAGQNVVTQGEKGNHFYIIDSGTFARSRPRAFFPNRSPRRSPASWYRCLTSTPLLPGSC